jgi:ATP-dependent Clp protease ATP-binding subunit ClpC
VFERYTEPARRVLFFARYEASQSGSSTIEAEHLLLGLIREGRKSPLLSQLPLENIRRELEHSMPAREKTPTSVEMPFSSEMKRVLQYAMEEADRLEHRSIGPEHLLLGVLKVETSTAAKILVAHGCGLETSRQRLREQGVENPAATAQPGAVASKGTVIVRLSRPLLESWIHQIKKLVQDLARAPRESEEALAIESQILTELDAINLDRGNQGSAP